jgi:MFS family permease
MTIVAMWFIDRMGRRPLLLTGTAGMIISLGGLAAMFAAHHSMAWLAVLCLLAYVASFAISLGPIFWLLISEIYPLNVRGLAEGAAAGANLGVQSAGVANVPHFSECAGTEQDIFSLLRAGHSILGSFVILST